MSATTLVGLTLKANSFLGLAEPVVHVTGQTLELSDRVLLLVMA